MNDEFPKFPRSSRQKANEKPAAARFFEKINRFFKREPLPEDLKLQGRIRELQTSAEKILVELLECKKALEKNSEPEIFALASTIIDPIIREIGRLQQVIDEHEGAAHQVKTVHRYIEWIDKARAWIDLGSNGHYQSHAIQQAIIAHTVQEFHARINRDIQIIEDYLLNSINSSPMSGALKEEIRKNIASTIASPLQQLDELKASPQNLSIDTLPQWRAQADEERGKCFGSALHTIDVLLSESTPGTVVEIESEHAMEILAELGTLESGIAELVEAIETLNNGEEGMTKKCLEALLRLEQQSHQLNGNLRLSQEHAERVQQAIDSLAALREKLS